MASTSSHLGHPDACSRLLRILGPEQADSLDRHPHRAGSAAQEHIWHDPRPRPPARRLRNWIGLPGRARSWPYNDQLPISTRRTATLSDKSTTVILSIAVHLILSAVDTAIDMPFTKSFGYEAVPRRNDRRSETEADTCSGTRAGVDIKLLLESKMEVERFVVNFE